MSDSGRRPPPPDPPTELRPAPSRLVMVRHGQSTWNESRRIQGQADPPLSKRGREEAELVAKRFSGHRFAGFYTSDLRRTRETAAALGAVLGREPDVRSELREVQLGDWEGLTSDELQVRYPKEWMRWVKEPSWDIVPGSEGAKVFESRVRRIVEELFERHPHGDVLVVTHGGVIQVALHQALGRTSNGLFVFMIQNTSVSILQKGVNRLVISAVNDVSHLQ